MSDRQDPAGNGINNPTPARLKRWEEAITDAHTGETAQVAPHVFDRLVAAHSSGDTNRAYSIAAGIRAAQVTSGTPGAKKLTNREKIRLRKKKSK